jgi:HAD superfamily hydrolase (TIGR01549 family)
MIKAIFFDVGNTLFFYNYEFLRGLLEDRFGIDATHEELEATHQIIRQSLGPLLDQGLSHEAIVEEAYRRWFRAIGIEEERIDSIIDAIKNHPFRHLFWSRMGEDTKEVLTWFRDRGYRLGIISNAEGQIKRLIDHAGLTSSFETILDSHEIGFQKPDERIFKRGLADLKVQPNEAVHVGDVFEADIVGARSAGIIPILVDREGRYPDASCLTIKHIGELKNLPIFEL